MAFIQEERLIQKISSVLPIKCYASKDLIKVIIEQVKEHPKLPELPKMDTHTEMEIRSVVNTGDFGGVTCEIVPVGIELPNPILTSITGLKIKKGEPFESDIKKYQIKRIRKLKREASRKWF